MPKQKLAEILGGVSRNIHLFTPGTQMTTFYPPKQGLFQSKQVSVGFQVYIYTCINSFMYLYVLGESFNVLLIKDFTPKLPGRFLDPILTTMLIF